MAKSNKGAYISAEIANRIAQVRDSDWKDLNIRGFGFLVEGFLTLTSTLPIAIKFLLLATRVLLKTKQRHRMGRRKPGTKANGTRKIFNFS